MAAFLPGGILVRRGKAPRPEIVGPERAFQEKFGAAR
jgi:hypothetical protein